MVTVRYEHQFSYTIDPLVGPIPALQLEIATPEGARWLEAEACLDSGASRSLFDGQLAFALGLDLLARHTMPFLGTAGTRLNAVMHRVRLRHDLMGEFELEVGFSTAPITRNLLGRDFFNLVQVGFRESQLTFYISTTP